MAASYPGAIWAPTTKTDKVDLVAAEHINRAQEETVAAQTELGADVAGTQTNLLTRLARMMANNGALAQGTSFPGSPNDGDIFYRTDQNVLYVYNGASWDSQGQSLSNVIFSWLGYDGLTAAGSDGLYNGVDRDVLAADNASNLFFMRHGSNGTAYATLLPPFKWTKIAGVSTLTFLIRTFYTDGGEGGGGPRNYTLQVDCGGQQSTLGITATQETPSWRTAVTIDVSGLSDGTTYDIQINSKADALGYTFVHKISGLIIMGS